MHARFHFLRGDFEGWFEFIGDRELAKKTSLLKGQSLSDEQLRQSLYEIVRNRCSQIKAILA